MHCSARNAVPSFANKAYARQVRIDKAGKAKIGRHV
jgi:hypothetical protein